MSFTHGDPWRPKLDWHRLGKNYWVNALGRLVLLYPIGAIAEAVDRDGVTVRGWLRTGVLPEARYRFRNGKRLFEPEVVEAIARIAADEGVTWPDRRSPITTNFKARVWAACSELPADPQLTAAAGSSL
jgi:hypothetical protein